MKRGGLAPNASAACGNGWSNVRFVVSQKHRDAII